MHWVRPGSQRRGQRLKFFISPGFHDVPSQYHKDGYNQDDLIEFHLFEIEFHYTFQ
jgi:hypothetical protein